MTDKQLNWSAVNAVRDKMRTVNTFLLSREARIEKHVAADASGENDYAMPIGDNDSLIPTSDNAMPSIDGNVSFRTTNAVAIKDVTLRLAKDPTYEELENASILLKYRYSAYKDELSKKYAFSPVAKGEIEPDSPEKETRVQLGGRVINILPEEKDALENFAYLTKEYSNAKTLYINAYTAGAGLNNRDVLNVERALNFTAASPEELLAQDRTVVQDKEKQGKTR